MLTELNPIEALKFYKNVLVFLTQDSQNPSITLEELGQHAKRAGVLQHPSINVQILVSAVRPHGIPTSRLLFLLAMCRDLVPQSAEVRQKLFEAIKEAMGIPEYHFIWLPTHAISAGPFGHTIFATDSDVLTQWIARRDQFDSIRLPDANIDNPAFAVKKRSEMLC